MCIGNMDNGSPVSNREGGKTRQKSKPMVAENSGGDRGYIDPNRKDDSTVGVDKWRDKSAGAGHEFESG